MVKVTVSGVTKEYETGITYGEVSKDFKDNCKYDIILAKQGAKLIELNKKIKTFIKVFIFFLYLDIYLLLLYDRYG